MTGVEFSGDRVEVVMEVLRKSSAHHEYVVCHSARCRCWAKRQWTSPHRVPACRFGLGLREVAAPDGLADERR